MKPSPWSPKVHIDGERAKWPSTGRPQSGAAPTTNNPIVSNEPAYESVVPCRIEPEIGIYGCRTDAPDPDPDDDERELTPGDVLRAVREIGLPSLQVKVQPGGGTLVNVPTIFYAEPQPFERRVRLLDFDVDLVAEPVGYQWVHGDGTTAATDTPGRPYPAMDVVHRYAKPADGLQARVDVTYRVRFRVDDGPWQTIGQTLVASGPPAALDVDEAAPVMTRP
ncbi:hypothetical protein DX116_12215 [Aeromicrobium endophyticum]|uniref:PKD domain-containing protein n=1 Tax=Aeromicrobium endophyticum TaxID=2292704 RepID=A0A371P1W9_9ACTN|nr:hypothetical protein DX116_12215 [Aeromicrobium endophyticum]